MQQPDSLDDLPLLKHHCTTGRRESISDYKELGKPLDHVEQGRPSHEILAEMTGRPAEEFEYVGEMPDYNELVAERYIREEE